MASIGTVQPSQGSSVNTTMVQYTLSENLDYGYVTWQRTAGNPDNHTHVQSLEGIELQALAGSLSTPAAPAGSSVMAQFTPQDLDGAYSLVRNPTGFLNCGDGTPEQLIPLNGAGVPVTGTCAPTQPGIYQIQFGVRQFGADRFRADGSIDLNAPTVQSTITRAYTAQ